MGALCSDPASNAAAAASATASADNAELAQEQSYVSGQEQQLRGAIAGLGPNPYFQPPNAPAPVNPANTTNFFAPTPQGASPPQQSPNLFAPQTRAAQPVARRVAAQ